MAAKPAIVVSHGAFHKPSQYSALINGLQDRGYEVHCPQLPSVGSSQENYEPDVAILTNTIESLLAKDLDIVLMAHSYGGIPASATAASFLKPAGSSGHGVIALIYMCAFLPAAGQSVADLSGGEEWLGLDEHLGQGYVKPEMAQHALYTDVLDQNMVDENIRQLRGQAAGTLLSKVDVEPWKEVRTTYIICELDQAILLPRQEEMAGRGGMIEAVRLKAAHSPWMSDLDNLVKVVVTVAEGKKFD